MTLVMDTKRTEIKKPADILKTQHFIWQEQVVFGLVLCLAGLFIMNNPMNFFKNLFELIIPSGIICLAIIFLARPFSSRLPEKYQAVGIPGASVCSVQGSLHSSCRSPCGSSLSSLFLLSG